MTGKGLKYIVLGMDSSVSLPMAIRRARPRTHVDCIVDHPVFLVNQFGMLERCALRHGIVHSADGWRYVLDPGTACYAKRRIGGFLFRADAAYAMTAIFQRLEEASRVYEIRLPANNVLP